MNKFFELQPDIFARYVPQLSSGLSERICFNTGAPIADEMPSPLVFTTGHSSKDPPKGMHGLRFPVLSNAFIGALQQVGIDNLQCFPAELRSNKDGTVWNGYQVVNIIGLVAAANLEKSQSTHIIDRPEEDALPLMAFDDLKIDHARAAGYLLFRLAESPG
jgi:hypothetical protein